MFQRESDFNEEIYASFYGCGQRVGTAVGSRNGPGGERDDDSVAAAVPQTQR